MVKGKVKPSSLKIKSLKPLIVEVKAWFKGEIRKAGIKPDSITSAFAIIKRKDAKVSTFYTIRAEISAREENTGRVRKFVGKSASGWMWGR